MGWKSVIYAKAEDVWIERVGNTYFTMRNNSEVLKEFLQKIEAEEIVEVFFILSFPDAPT
ncbi:MAG: hypothetical protein ACE5K0_04775 [Candidatus Methanofastidiosia archaeon]